MKLRDYVRLETCLAQFKQSHRNPYPLIALAISGLLGTVWFALWLAGVMSWLALTLALEGLVAAWLLRVIFSDTPVADVIRPEELAYLESLGLAEVPGYGPLKARLEQRGYLLNSEATQLVQRAKLDQMQAAAVDVAAREVPSAA